MSKTLILVTLLLAGCAHRNVDPNFYDYQWAKAGATEEQWKRDSHDCDVEEHQRTTYDKTQFYQNREQEWEYNRTIQQMGSPYYYSTAGEEQDAMNAKRYWDECMVARSWKMIGRKPLGTEDTGVEANSRSFKP